MTHDATSGPDPREAVVDAARHISRTVLYTAPVLDAAAALLADVWSAAAKHGVRSADLDVAYKCLEVVAKQQRGTIPQSEWDAEELLAELVKEFTNLGVTATLDGETGLVLIPRGPGTPPWSNVQGLCSLGVTMISEDTLGGWHLGLDSPGTYLVGVAASHDRAGAAAVAQLAVELNAGRRGNPFKR